MMYKLQLDRQQTKKICEEYEKNGYLMLPSSAISLMCFTNEIYLLVDRKEKEILFDHRKDFFDSANYEPTTFEKMREILSDENKEKKLDVEKENYKCAVTKKQYKKIQKIGRISGVTWRHYTDRIDKDDIWYISTDKRDCSIWKIKGSTAYALNDNKIVEAKKLIRHLKKRCLEKIVFLALKKENYKIQVNPEQSAKIQEGLFAMGITWFFPYKKPVANTGAPYLYIENGDLTYGLSSHNFSNKKSIELGADALIKYLRGKEK